MFLKKPMQKQNMNPLILIKKNIPYMLITSGINLNKNVFLITIY